MAMSYGTKIAGGLAVAVAIFAPMINHVVWCIDKASETGSAIALLIVGIVVTPVGWVHGVSLFFGATWI